MCLCVCFVSVCFSCLSRCPSVVVQLKSGITDHVLMRMFRISIFQLPVCDARVFVVQLKSGIRDHVFMRCSVYVYINYLSAMLVSSLIKQSPG